jgi:hypothetical protein
MGRPLAKKYFGNTDPGGIGGEGVASITGPTGSNYSSGTTVTFSRPQLPGGVTATAAVNVALPTGTISYTVINTGSGYITGPTGALATPATVTGPYVSITGTGASTTVTIGPNTSINSVIYPGMVISGTGFANSQKVTSVLVGPTNTSVVLSTGSSTGPTGTMTFTDTGSGGGTPTGVLTTSNFPAVRMTAYIPGGSAALEADVVKQKGSHEFLVKTSDGQGIVSLVNPSGALVAGQATITALDSNGSSYYVTKLTAHKAVVWQNNMVTAFEYPNEYGASWSFASATPGVIYISSTP